MKEVITAWGHPNITAKHRTTLEITKDEELSIRGDCIIGVRADKAICDINEKIKNKIKLGYRVEIELYLPQYGLKDELVGFGAKEMTFKHKTDIVVRKSSYVCDRTLVVKSNKAALDLNREMIELLKDPKTELRFIIKV